MVAPAAYEHIKIAFDDPRLRDTAFRRMENELARFAPVDIAYLHWDRVLATHEPTFPTDRFTRYTLQVWFWYHPQPKPKPKPKEPRA